MPKVTVFAENFIKADKLAEVKPLFAELVAKTNKENGCISYSLYQDAGDETHFMMFEEWESDEALAAHFKAEHFTRIVPQLKEMASKPGTLLKGGKIA